MRKNLSMPKQLIRILYEDGSTFDRTLSASADLDRVVAREEAHDAVVAVLPLIPAPNHVSPTYSPRPYQRFPLNPFREPGER